MEKKHFQKMGILFGAALLTALPVTMLVTSCSTTSDTSNHNDDKKSPNSKVFDLPKKEDPKARVSPDQHDSFTGDNSKIIEDTKESINNMTKDNFMNDIKYFLNGIAGSNSQDKKFTTAKIDSFDIKDNAQALSQTTTRKASFKIEYSQMNVSNKKIFINSQPVLIGETVNTTLIANSTSILPKLITVKDLQFASYSFKNVDKTVVYPNNGDPQTETTKEQNYMINRSKSYFINKSYKGYAHKSNYKNIADQSEVIDFINGITSANVEKGMDAFTHSINSQANTYVDSLHDMLDYLSWYLNGSTTEQKGNLDFLGLVVPQIKAFIPYVEIFLSNADLSELFPALEKQFGIALTDTEKKAITKDIGLIKPFITSLAESVGNFKDMVTTKTAIINAPVVSNGKASFDYQETFTIKKSIVIQIKGANGLETIFKNLNIKDLKPLIDLASPGLTDQITKIQGYFSSELTGPIIEGILPDTFGLYAAKDGKDNADQVTINFKANDSKIEPSYNKDLTSLGFKLSDVNVGFQYRADQMLANLNPGKYPEVSKTVKDILNNSVNFTKLDGQGDNKLNIVIDTNGLTSAKHLDYDMSSYASNVYLKGRQISWKKDAAKNLTSETVSPYDVTKADILNQLNFDNGKNIVQADEITISDIPLGVNLDAKVLGFFKVGVKLYNNFITVNFAKPVTYFNGTKYVNTNSISLNAQFSKIKLPF